MLQNQKQVRLLTSDDIYEIQRVLRSSEYIYQRFTLTELPFLLQRYPAVGILNGASLHGFLLSQIINLPFAWISGFGVSWTESKEYIPYLTRLLEALTEQLWRSGARYLHYSGNDTENDWLRPLLMARGFLPYRKLYAYDKYDESIPTQGNQDVSIRPVDFPRDMQALLDIEAACFEDIWRYDTLSFLDIAATHPYFVVAELQGRVVAYQFNTLDDDYGYLVRIAVHPSADKRGIGARLMAEAVRFFQQAHVSRIMLNTQEDNYHAHRLYEWFGFIRLEQRGFVLRKTL